MRREQALVWHGDLPTLPDQPARQGIICWTGPAKAPFPLVAAPQGHRPPGLRQDRLHHRQPARRAVAGQDRGINDAWHLAPCKGAHGGGRQRRDRRQAREHANPCRARVRIQRRYTSAKTRIVRKIKIVDTSRNRRAGQTVGVVAVGVKRARRVDDDVMRRQRPQILAAVHLDRPTPQVRRAGLGGAQRAARDANIVTVNDQQFSQTSAKNSISAQQQDLHRSSRF